YGGPGDDNTGLDEAYTLGLTVAQQFALAGTRGLGFLAITDHEDVRSQSDPGFGDGGVIAVRGYETSLRGHAQMLGAGSVYDRGDASPAAVNAMAERLRAEGGVFQVNHPALGAEEDWEYGDAVVPDTVEVWNISHLYQPPLPSASDNDAALAHWEAWLDRGVHVAATGGSDSHWLSTSALQGVGQPTTWVYAMERSEAGLLAGLRAGRTFVSWQPPALGGPRLFLEADRDGDGDFDAMVGDTVPAGSRLRVRVEGAPLATVRIVGTGGALLDEALVAGVSFAHTFTAPPGTNWVRAEVVMPDGIGARRALCDPLLGPVTTYCRNRIAVLAMTSALYLAASPEA
ncbi:MAG: CehA/McbA family metallohydrolase, partial [Acidimicrobiales bacterium]